MKENFDRFISCKNTIDNIHARLKKTETDGGEGAHGASAVVVTAAIGDVRCVIFEASSTRAASASPAC